ncbi:MAG: flagellar M-ring protein FliF [Myxococcota bacterium]|jgi:flagellar M-ring protein FliF
MNEFIARLTAWWESRDPAQRVRTVGSLAGVIAVAVALSVWASSTTWRPVMHGEYNDLLIGASALQQADILYKIGDDGRLMVPASQLGSAQAAITAADVTPGLGDVSDLKLGLTPRAQEWALVRAREGDLSRMINGIDGIASSQVQIVARQDAFFLDEQRPARASVFVRLSPGAELGQGQVRAIRSLVSSSVDGLDPEQVTLADDRGTLLARAEVAGAFGDPADLTTYRREMEAELEGSVLTALMPVLGSPRFFSVAVGIDLDMTSSETVSKQLAIQEQAVLSEQIQESATDRNDARGIPGVDANLPEGGVNQAGAAQTSERSALVTNYAYPTVDEIRRRPAGGVNRISVAVQVDSGRLAEMVVAAGNSMTLEELQSRIEQAVRAAANVSDTRDDVVQVGYLPFAEVEWEETEAASMLPFVPETILPWAVAGLAVILGFLFVVRPVMSAAMAPVPKVLTEEEEVQRAAEAEAESKVDPRTRDHKMADRLVDLVENYQPMDTTMLNELVENQSTAAAQVLRQWNRNG